MVNGKEGKAAPRGDTDRGCLILLACSHLVTPTARNGVRIACYRQDGAHGPYCRTADAGDLEGVSISFRNESTPDENTDKNASVS
jgi:hypothetical protein